MTPADLIRRVEALGAPRVLVVGDLVLDRYVWGDAARISPEAPIPVLKAGPVEERLGGAAAVAALLRALGAEVELAGVVGNDHEADELQDRLDELGVEQHLWTAADGRPTTLKTRYVGRAQGRHPQQLLRVDRESCDPAPVATEAAMLARLPGAAARCAAVLISDYGKGVCTPALLRALIAAARPAGARVLVDPARAVDWARYRGAHALKPNRLEAGLAVGADVRTPADGLAAARALAGQLGLEAALVTLDRDGLALARADGRAELVPTRPREVYDVTGAGDTALAALGLALAAGADYGEAAALANVAGGLQVERIGVALLSREEIIRDLLEHSHPERSKQPSREALVAEVRRRQASGQKVIFTNGCFDLLHVGHARLLREAAALGDYLVVGLNSDASARRLKGPTRPIVPEAHRAELLAALACVDAVVVFDEDTPIPLLRELRPDVLAKGADYPAGAVAGRDIVEAYGGRVVQVPVVPGVSTTTLAARRDG